MLKEIQLSQSLHYTESHFSSSGISAFCSPSISLPGEYVHVTGWGRSGSNHSQGYLHHCPQRNKQNYKLHCTSEKMAETEFGIVFLVFFFFPSSSSSYLGGTLPQLHFLTISFLQFMQPCISFYPHSEPLTAQFHSTVLLKQSLNKLFLLYNVQMYTKAFFIIPNLHTENFNSVYYGQFHGFSEFFRRVKKIWKKTTKYLWFKKYQQFQGSNMAVCFVFNSIVSYKSP